MKQYQKFSLKAFLLALGIFTATQLSAANNITKHGECLDDVIKNGEKINAPGFIEPEQNKNAGAKDSKKSDKDKTDVYSSTGPSKLSQIYSNMKECAKEHNVKIGLAYPVVSNSMKASADSMATPIYSHTAKGSGFGVSLSGDINVWKSTMSPTVNVSLDSAKEHLKTYNVLKSRDIGTIDTTRNNLELTLSKNLEKWDLTGGLISYNSSTSEDYAGIPAQSKISLTGVKGNAEYTLDAKGRVKVGYGLKYLASTGSSDIDSMLSKEYSFSLGPLEFDVKDNAFNSTNPGINQAVFYERIFPTEFGFKANISDKVYVAAKTLSGNNFKATANGLEGEYNLTDNISAKIVYTRAERESRNKEIISERTTFNLTYDFGDKK